MNKVFITGRLTKDIELRSTTTGVSTLNNSIAVKKDYKNTNGEYESDFINIIAWKNTAEFINNYATKGSKVCVEGRLQTRNYDDKDGKKVYVTEVVVDKIELLDKKKETKEEVKPTVEEPKSDVFAEFGEQLEYDDNFLD